MSDAPIAQALVADAQEVGYKVSTSPALLDGQ